MSVYDKSFDLIIDKALNTLFGNNVEIYTFAFYYDHESHSVEILVDTAANSKKVVPVSDRFSHNEFMKAIQSKDLERASRWSALRQRNLSLGDFKHKALGWDAAKAPNNSAPFFLAMANAIIRNSKKIAALSESPEDLVFLCSTQENEVGLIWRYFP